MEIAIPSEAPGGMGAAIYYHFGRCPYYTIVDTETGSVEIMKNESTHFGGEKLPPELLTDKGVKILLCSGIGARALSLFADLGIKVYVGAEGTVKEAFEQWRSELLKLANEDDSCEEHKH